MYDVATFVGDALRSEQRLPTKVARNRVLKYFRSGELRQGLAKTYRWDRGELVVEPDHVWVYEWDEDAGQIGDWVPVDTVEGLISR